MASIGSFGTPRDAVVETDTFDWFGTEVRTNPMLSDLDLADFMEVAGGIDADDPKTAIAAMGTVKGFLRSAVHEDDFDAFWATAKTNRQGLQDLLPVAMQIMGAVLGRPTGLPSVSTDGQQPTQVSSSRDAASVAAQAYPDRPDLQLAVLHAVS